jgi:catechol 2,3-dioxygenase-like lactoylglutathione lyase family enzyme
MVTRIGQWTLDVRDAAVMARFWAAALGYRIEADGDGSVHLWPPSDGVPGAPSVWLQASAGPKQGKNRNHPDLVTDGDVDAEVDRLLALGARYADVGQTGQEGFVVLADPEGNEFCMLRRGQPDG